MGHLAQVFLSVLLRRPQLLEEAAGHVERGREVGLEHCGTNMLGLRVDAKLLGEKIFGVPV